MPTNRRNFFKLSSAGLIAAQLSSCSVKNPFTNTPTRLYGGYRSYGDTYGAACINQDGELIWKFETPARLHETCLSEDLSLGAVVARRPGSFIQLFAPESGQGLGQIQAPEGIIFEGHALFRTKATGDLELWATASPTATSNALLLKYQITSANNKLQISAGETIAIPGLGPHQMLLRNSAEDLNPELVIAVGGWQSIGRTILNANTFESGLVFFDLENHSSQFVPMADKDLSARHLSTSGNELWVGMQLADPAPTSHALVYRYSKTDGWNPADEPATGWHSFNGYIASVTTTDKEVVATSPQGHIYGRWDLSGRSIETSKVLDISAATNINNQWWLSSGLGEVNNAGKEITSGIFWDNHWVGHS